MNSTFFRIIGVIVFSISSIGCVSDTEILDGTPRVVSVAISDFSAKQLFVTANLINPGTSQIKEKGICWGTKVFPTTKDNKVVAEDNNIGNYSVTIIGLNESTTYYIRAYATNDMGTSYSDQIDATTQVVNMLLVDGGTFTMGNTSGTALANETPAHQVTINDYYLGATEITQKQWTSVMDNNPSENKANGDLMLPVDKVSWYNTLVFCNKLSIMEGLIPCYSIKKSTDPNDWGPVPNPPGGTDPVWDMVVCNWYADGYRLPTEAEWEYAAGGGAVNRTIYSGTNDVNKINDYAWTKTNSPAHPNPTDKIPGTTSPVKTKLPNALGFYDMGGNLVEWCWDYDNLFTSVAQNNPKGPLVQTPGDVKRIYKGGSNSWEFYWVSWRSVNRGKSMSNQVGFRIARNR